jgi:hypothetical protein
LPKEQGQVGVEDVALMVWSPRKLTGSKMIVEMMHSHNSLMDSNVNLN